VDEHSLSLGVWMGRKAKIPVFCLVTDPPFTDRYRNYQGFIRKIEKTLRTVILSKLLNCCSGIFCFIEKEILREFNVREDRIYQMMNGTAPLALEWARGQARIDQHPQEYVIGLVGFTPPQGLNMILKCFAEVRRRIQNSKMLLIGPMDANYEPEYRKQLQRLKLNSAVRVTGWLPYLKALECLQDCSVGVYCNPSTDWFRAAQPLKVCEYLALGKPTVAWDYPGVRRLLDGGRLGILVPYGDMTAFADALVCLADTGRRAPIEYEIRQAIRGRWASDYWYGQLLDQMTLTTEKSRHVA
jgi:glycosyltransferase involved in cell wall biosynthesis